MRKRRLTAGIRKVRRKGLVAYVGVMQLSQRRAAHIVGRSLGNVRIPNILLRVERDYRSCAFSRITTVVVAQQTGNVEIV